MLKNSSLFAAVSKFVAAGPDRDRRRPWLTVLYAVMLVVIASWVSA